MLKWDIGMIANSSTFHPYPGRVTGNGANAASVSVQALMLAVVVLQRPAIEC